MVWTNSKSCKICDKKFPRKKGLSKTQWDKQCLCSKECAGRNRQKKETRVCRNCKKKFLITPHKPNVLCSRECFYSCKERHSKISSRLLGRTSWNKGKKSLVTGKNHPNWKGGITPIDKLERQKFKLQIANKVLERDNYTCQICKKRGVHLQVDHIQPWAEYVEGRFDINNCRTLCVDCHYFITFGKVKPKEVKTWGLNLKYNTHLTN